MLVAYGATVAVSGADSVGAALVEIGWPAIVAGCAVTLLSLGLRLARWQWLLRLQGYRLPLGLQARVYIAGIALSATPGKVGETARSLLLRPHGVAFRHSIAAFGADRAADVIAVATLGAAAGLLAGQRQWPLEVVGAATLAGSLLLAIALRTARGQRWLASRGSRLRSVALPLVAWAELWRTRPLLGFVALAALAYGLQALMFWAFLTQVHTGLDTATCVSIFATATLIGAASMVPGGLGTMDAALVLQLTAAGVLTGDALAVAIATRFCTLWIAWLLGLAAISSFARAEGLPS
jgi:uncharacterized membrane protein YbhN (UPF0104 family)